MIFVILLVLSPIVAGSFTSMCPQQPNNVVVNCNNANPPYIPNYPNFPNFPRVSGRVLDIGYNKPPPGSKLELAIERSDRSDESRSSEESNESKESSEEMHHHHHHIPLSVVSHYQVPSIHTSTTVNNRLDFINSLRRLNPDLDVNKLRSVLRNHIPSHTGQVTLGQITTGSGISGIMGTGHETIHIDETHGHGHTGQYNHGLPEHGHHEHYGHGHDHFDHHEHGPNQGYVHNHEASTPQLLIPTHITHIPHTTTISEVHRTPERIELPTGHVITSGTSGTLMDSEGLIIMDNGDPRITQISPTETHGHGTSGQYNHAMDLLHDTHDRLILSTRGLKSLDAPLRGTYELYPQDLLNRIITSIPVATVNQNTMTTEITCDQIPIISEVPHAQTGASQTMVPDRITVHTEEVNHSSTASNVRPPASINGNQGVVVTTVTHSEKVPISDVAIKPSTVIHADEHTKVPITEQGSTVTKVTTTKVEERPIETEMTVPTSQTIVHGMPMQTGSTVTKVTTTKVGEQLATTDTGAPIADNMVHKMPVQTSGSGGSTVTTITTTTLEERPIASEIKETVLNATPIQTDSTVTKVTTTTTQVDDKSTSAEITAPTVESIVHETPVQTDSTVTKVTTTTVEERPMTSTVEHTFQETPDEISEIFSIDTGIEKGTDPQVTDEIVDSTIGNSPSSREKVRIIRDETHRYDSYRQRSGPSVYRV